MTLRFFVVGILLGLLSACVSLTPPAEDEVTFAFDVPSDLNSWSANGKFSFRSPESRDSGQFYWNQNGEDYLLRLVGPFGVGAAEVEQIAGSLVIRSRGETYQGEVTDQLLLELTGVSVPVNQLSNILLGDHQALQNAWRVDYQTAMEVEDYLLPERLTLTSGNQELQIFISRWSI